MDEANTSVVAQLNERRAELAEAITDRHYQLHPELEARYGRRGREKCREDAVYHLRYLSEAVAAARPALFVDYIGWAKVMLAGRGIPASDLADNLHVLDETLNEQLGEGAKEILDAYIGSALESLPALPSQLPCELPADSSVGDLDKRYLELLLKGDRRQAAQMILDAVAEGVAIKDLYLHVFQKTQYEIGRLWQMNMISVAQEHFCTAATQLIMSQLYPHIFSHTRRDARLVVACIGGDLHELGVRIVADFFEMEGWDTYYLGANMPTDGVINSVVEHDAHILGISATMTFHVQAVADSIAALRQRPECAHVKIMVGGYPFKVDPELWKQVGADATAADADAAIAVAEQLLKGDR